LRPSNPLPAASPASCKPFIIPLFIPHAGCPHRCVFCDQSSTTGAAAPLPPLSQIHAAIAQFLGYRRDAGRFTEISFYGGNFLGLDPATLVRLLEAVSPYVDQGRVDGIRFSTRPDTIDDRRLALISGFPVTTVELGVQSMNDTVLSTARRGHSAQDVIDAVAQLRQTPYTLGLQVMIGLPGDTPALAIATGEQIAALGPDFVRIYPALVIEGSPLARWYRQGRYLPWEMETAIEVAGRLYTLFAGQGIDVIRMGLQPTAELNTDRAVLAGPFHPAFGELVHSALWFQCLCDAMDASKIRSGRLVLGVNPRCLSRVRGHRNGNIRKLQSKYVLSAIRVVGIAGLDPRVILVNGSAQRLL
jgi:histone acetyltransferase (RNA polymerase elongator complex component)